MRIYVSQVGATKVPYGQFYGGTEGWTLRALAGPPTLRCSPCSG
jgi:hypothetical protein